MPFQPTTDEPITQDLKAHEVHLWQIDLSLPAQGERDTLSDDEQRRAERLKILASRTRFVHGRVALRAILGRYLQTPPRELVFTYGEHGKPFIADSTSRLHFNFSHSGDVALLAVAAVPVGVDVEIIRPLSAGEYDTITTSAFTERERMRLAGLPASDKLADLFGLWVSKEACVKAVGSGYRDIQRVEIAPDSWNVPAIIALADAPVEQWSLMIWRPIPGGIAACVVQQHDAGYRFYNRQD